ncbi:MAG: hypothetical protein M1829_006873 [Trizodia sp. TS-e1964]|nr:MAG: hypothetical protein M1829_006873 [Trizodia sp. TS-e1964]
MGQSRSEISMARSICPSPTDTKQSQEYSPNRTNKIETILPERGRTNTRSPTKFLEGIDYDTVPELLSSPVKRSRSPIKKMFGENGWLGRSTSMKEMPSEQYRKTGLKHWGGKLKGRVEVLVVFPDVLFSAYTEEMTRFKIRPRSPEPCSPPTSRFPISLDPPTQAKLYSEIELMICVTANAYLMMQRREGRMSVESLQRVTEFWRNKGRPQVVEFQFDQATQRDLVLYNLKSFRFYGEKAENPVALNSMMYCWKSLAKEMNVRTFCAPDSVIRKQMHDIYKILEMLGAPLTTFLAFQEIQVKALKKMRDEQERRDLEAKVEYGVERVWVPPVKGEDDESDMLGPFCGIPNPFEN